MKNKFSFLLVFIAGFLLLTGCGESASEEKVPLPESNLKWEEVSTKKHIKGGGREQIDLIIALTPGQDEADQAEIAGTAMKAAVEYQQKTKAPIISVKLISQKPTIEDVENGMLALAVYIPDGKGYNGKQEIGPWDMLMATNRLLTAEEMEYLNLWNKLGNKYMTDGILGFDGEEKLDAEIRKIMEIEPDSLNPFLNVMAKFEF